MVWEPVGTSISYISLEDGFSIGNSCVDTPQQVYVYKNNSPGGNWWLVDVYSSPMYLILSVEIYAQNVQLHVFHLNWAFRITIEKNVLVMECSPSKTSNVVNLYLWYDISYISYQNDGINSYIDRNGLIRIKIGCSLYFIN